MSYINIDTEGKVYTYTTEKEAVEASYKLPINWKVIALFTNS